jgi:hypothetical protein
VRILLSATALLFTASCAYEPLWQPRSPPPGQLSLSNYRFEQANVEAVATASPDCAAADPAVQAAAFDLPFKATRVIAAPPAADICWRTQAPGGPWSGWNRAFTASGRYVDARL